MDIWEREKGEPSLWYGRFEVFRLLGPGRSLDGAYGAEEQGRRGEGEQGREAKGSKGKHKKRPSRHWYAAAKRWRWIERAEAWDGAERERVRGLEADRRFDARQRRLSQIEAVQTGTFAALSKIKWDELEQAQVLALLPQLRLVFSDMMKAERLEYGEASEITKDADGLDVAAEVAERLRKVYG